MLPQRVIQECFIIHWILQPLDACYKTSVLQSSVSLTEVCRSSLSLLQARLEQNIHAGGTGQNTSCGVFTVKNVPEKKEASRSGQMYLSFLPYNTGSANFGQLELYTYIFCLILWHLIFPLSHFHADQQTLKSPVEAKQKRQLTQSMLETKQAVSSTSMWSLSFIQRLYLPKVAVQG